MLTTGLESESSPFDNSYTIWILENLDLKPPVTLPSQLQPAEGPHWNISVKGPEPLEARGNREYFARKDSEKMIQMEPFVAVWDEDNVLIGSVDAKKDQSEKKCEKVLNIEAFFDEQIDDVVTKSQKRPKTRKK